MSDDPQQRFLRDLKRELRGWPLTRRRFLAEIAAHVDDIVTELEASGLGRDVAVQEALRRLGDVRTISAAFRHTPPSRRRWAKVRSLRSPAWVAVGAMSVVTAWAAELPPASGAKATTQALGMTQSHSPAQAVKAKTAQDHRLSRRARHRSRR